MLPAAPSFDRAEFERVQARLAPFWPALTIRHRPEPRTLFVVSSMSVDVPPHILPLLPAYEERYLFYVLALARQPGSRVVYVTSQPVLPRMFDYYLSLMDAQSPDKLRNRIIPLSVGEGSMRPLTQKILERPRLVERMRSLVADPDHAVILPFVTTEWEAALACRLGVPVYGPDPRLSFLGTKSGSRQVFAAAGVPLPRGAEGVRTVDDVVDALEALDPLPEKAIVKLDASVSGLGNAEVDLRGVDSRRDIAWRVRALRPEDTTLIPPAFLQLLAEAGGVVEERIVGADIRSPSVQLRASPLGEVEVLSTHDQVLGGDTGQSYLGCRFPAAPEYAPLITRHAVAIGKHLSSEGVIGRFAIDFVVVRNESGWDVYAIEINLRQGGTTHPALSLLGLTDGHYDQDACTFAADGVDKHYTATDHLAHESYRSLTPDDVLDVIEQAGLEWDGQTKTGVVFHMISAVAVAGMLGLTAIGNSPAEADSIYRRAEAALLEASC